MNRRGFLELSAVGIAGACLPSLAFTPTQDELIDRALTLESEAMTEFYTILGLAVESGQPLPSSALGKPRRLYRESITAYQDALRQEPRSVLTLELMRDVQMEAARLESLIGGNPQPQLVAAISCAEKWCRICPEDPIPARVLVQTRGRAGRILAAVSEPMPPLLVPTDIRRWHQRTV